MSAAEAAARAGKSKQGKSGWVGEKQAKYQVAFIFCCPALVLFRSVPVPRAAASAGAQYRLHTAHTCAAYFHFLSLFSPLSFMVLGTLLTSQYLLAWVPSDETRFSSFF